MFWVHVCPTQQESPWKSLPTTSGYRALVQERKHLNSSQASCSERFFKPVMGHALSGHFVQLRTDISFFLVMALRMSIKFVNNFDHDTAWYCSAKTKVFKQDFMRKAGKDATRKAKEGFSAGWWFSWVLPNFIIMLFMLQQNPNTCPAKYCNG